MQSITTGTANTGVGQECLLNVTGDKNTCMGQSAGWWLNSGNYNTTMGYVAGYNLTTGSDNLLLGYNAGTASSPSGAISTGSNAICLGNNSIGDAHIKVDWTVSSDKRDKTDIEPFNHGLSWINKLNPVTYRWDNRCWYDDGKPDGSKKKPQLCVGLLAQDELEVEKEHGFGDTSDNMIVTHVNTDGNYGMKYSKLVPILINAVKELSTKVTQLEVQLNG